MIGEMIGSAAGGWLGGPPGAAIGAAAGGVLDHAFETVIHKLQHEKADSDNVAKDNGPAAGSNPQCKHGNGELSLSNGAPGAHVMISFPAVVAPAG
ncbi:hypothetical protein [Bradyrhizobium sp. CB3481]|uniref:hypothetical protein n=1 Tax=Bradyrhizobium sp. CB3481 TaxID=3039158 RepID=UPI0024B178BA|nr:hypothetical protein [Bradyrhizobium sp. CB3481]WFU14796.1 hypothetical protein QA643_27565 [Bradyrhizobium sp. CB3481]